MLVMRALSTVEIAVALVFLAAPVFGQDTQARIQSLYEEARSKEQAGDMDGAVEKYRSILRLDPKLAAAYNNLGRL